LNNNSIIIYGDGTQTRDFIHVEDICNGIHSCLVNDLKSNFNIFQLGSGTETSILDIHKLLSRIIGKEIKIEFKEKRAGDIYRNYSNIKHAQHLIDFNPKIKLDNGLSDLVGWFKKSKNY
jgi:UDP-glucose 4-epimerase